MPNISAFGVIVSFLFAACVGADVDGVKKWTDLTDDVFESTLTKYDVLLVMFMVKGCTSCNKFKTKMPSVQKFLDSGTPYNVKLATVDCNGGGEAACRRYSVTGYPTIKMFKNGKFWKEYDGGHTFRGIQNYMVDHAMPCPAMIDTEEKLNQVSSDGNVYVAFFRKGVKDSSLKDIFLATAHEIRGLFRMGICENPDMIQKYHPRQEGIVFFRDQRMRNKFERDRIIYSGSDNKTELEAWMASVKHGLVGVRTPENMREFKTPLIVAYYHVDVDYNLKKTMYWRNRVLKVARKHRTFSFAISNKIEFQNDFFQFGYQIYPIMVEEPIVLARTKTKKFKMTQNFSVDALDKFVKGIKTKTLKPFVRSAKPPKKNDGVVKTVVADTFELLVFNSPRDSFILLYVTDCSLCKKVKSLWTKIGRAMIGEEVDLLKMDVGKNDRPSKYTLIGMPVAYWVPKNDKNKPLRYRGHWEYFDLIEFIAKSATEELIARNRRGRIRKDEL